jgi:RNA polymerase sigma-70 factor (ECF subfamily)
MLSDEELMHAVRQGDLSSFEQIVLRHQQTAWRVACRFLGDPTEAEDVAQDAFLRILKAAPSYRPTAKLVQVHDLASGSGLGTVPTPMF